MMVTPAAENASSEVFRREHLPLKYYISSEMPDNAAQEVQAAFKQWERDLQTEVFEFGGYVDYTNKQINNQYHPLKNVIFVTDASGKIDPPRGDGFDAIARTFVHGASAIRDTDVVLYEYERNYVVGRNEEGDIYSIKTVMMHEIGRMLFGSRDGTDAKSVLNNPIYPKDHPDEKTRLSEGDIELFFEVYADML